MKEVNGEWSRSRLKTDHPITAPVSSVYRGGAVVFLTAALLLLAAVTWLYVWLVFTPFPLTFPVTSSSCLEDGEGSWSIGVFFGDSPFSLLPIDSKDVWKNESGAWPVANPVISCGTASTLPGYPSNFVADPFLFILDDVFYLFYETKNSITKQGDIGVSKSIDKGATWKHLGIALDEDWHLSFPYIFEYNGKVYMLPESSQKAELRLYRAVNFPLQWELEKVLLNKPLIDTFLIKHETRYWIFGSDHSGFGARKNGQLEIWHSDSPFGPWVPHRKNPIHNVGKSLGARNGGRPFIYDGNLYRVGQDCGETYGRKIRTFKVEVLTEQEYKEIEVPSGFKESKKGRNAWNGARYHHLDAQQLSSGVWIGVMDGDRVPSGDSASRFILGCVSILAVAALVVLLGVLLGAVKCLIPLNWCPHNLRKRSDTLLLRERPNMLTTKLRWMCTRLNRIPACLRAWIRPNSCTGKVVLLLIVILGVGLMCNGVTYMYGGNGAEPPYPVNGQYSQFTLLTMTYDARLWNLKMYIKHYSRCSSVREIVVIWNKGKAPDESEFDSAVPVRIRVEQLNSLNNRFKIDPLIRTRAILELDDDIMMRCDDVERGFKVWRDHPDRIVGFYPRLVDGKPLKYRAEKYARRKKGYNMILTGAAFMDAQLAFDRYWSVNAKVGRTLVDKFFNCEDVLLNYLYANASRSAATVEYVKPAWAIDTSKFSSVAISRDTGMHYQKRSECLSKFSEIYGSLSDRKSEFNQRKDGWDV